MANPNGNPQYLKSWKPGQSGNPNGRPKRKTFMEGFLATRTEADEEAYRKVFDEKLKSGEGPFWKEYLERRDGKVKEEMEITQALPEVLIMLPEKKNEDCVGSAEGPANRISGE